MRCHALLVWRGGVLGMAQRQRQQLGVVAQANATYEGPAFGDIATNTSCSVGVHDLCAIQSSEECAAYPGYPGPQHAGCTYVDETFTDAVIDVIDNHDPATPLFLFWAPHTIHSPLQVPKKYLDRFPFIDDWRRRRYAAGGWSH